MTNTEHAPELLPCPFCGNDRVAIGGREISCDCGVLLTKDSIEQALKRWNARDDAYAELVSLLKEVESSDMAMREEDEGNTSPLLQKIRKALSRDAASSGEKEAGHG